MPPVFSGNESHSLDELASKLGLDAEVLKNTVQEFNAACKPGEFDHTTLDNCHTEGIAPEKTHWATTIEVPPFYGYPLRPGVTFTSLGLKTDETSAIFLNGTRSNNLFVAGEMMAGNILGKGYTAGIGMAIGTAFGRIAGRNAASAAGNESRCNS